MRFLIKLSFFFVLALFFFQKLNAQDITVLTKATNEPIPDVAIYNQSKSKSIITDFDGIADISVFDENEVLYFTHVSHISTSLVKTKVLKAGNKVYLEAAKNQLSEVMISFSKWEQERKDIPQKIVSITSKDILLNTPQTSADLLQSSSQVFVQKSQLGGGSPIIRGFSTNRLLLTVDGVRMNTAIFRGGNVQNIISIDPFSVDRTEVILGAGSVIYGSDAVGGVMNFYTKKPKFSRKSKNKVSANFISRYASASNEKTGHADINIGLEKLAFLTSLSYTDFDDLKMGRNGPEDYLRTDYVDRIDGQDILVANDNPRKQISTGYDQINIMQKVKYLPNEKLNFDLGFNYSTTSPYDRYDRLIRRDDNTGLRSAQWFYGPQRWFMANYHASYKSNALLYDKMKLTMAYQYFEESRNDRNFGSRFLEKTKEQVDAYSASLDFEKKYNKKTSFYYGLDYILNAVYSDGSVLDIENNTSRNAPSRYPDGSTWQSIAAYVSLKHKYNEKIGFQGGLRYNRIILYSQFDDEFFDFPFEEANLDTDAITGTAGFSWLPNDILHWKMNFSTAFRAPNIDDIGKIFDSEPGSVVVPNPDLVPEYAYNSELGLTINLDDIFSLDLAGYYTFLDNALVRADFNLNGETEIIFGGEVSNVQAIQNAANAKIFGFEAGMRYHFAKNLKFRSQYTYVGGKEILQDGVIIASRHVAPQYGTSHLTYSSQKLIFEAFAQYAGKFDFEDLAPSQQNNTFLYAKDRNGNPYSPSWYTLNIRTQYQIMDKLQGIFSIENVTDQRYRPYSSGITGAGRNFILSLKYSL